MKVKHPTLPPLRQQIQIDSTRQATKEGRKRQKNTGTTISAEGRELSNRNRPNIFIAYRPTNLYF